MTLPTIFTSPLTTVLMPPSALNRSGFTSDPNTPINTTTISSNNNSTTLSPARGGIMFSEGVTWVDEVNGNNSSSSFFTTTPALPDPQYYDPVYHGVAVTLSFIVFMVGFVGNVLVVIVIARSRSMHTTTNCYLLSLAVADCLVLLSGTLPAVPETFYRIDEWPFGRVLCSILIYAQYVGVDASSLSITAFTIERYIAICHPMRAQTMCTVSRAKKITGGLWLFTTLYCGPWLGLTDLNVRQLSDGSTITKCQFRLARSSYLVLYMFDLVVFYILPFLISTVLYGLIARILVLTSLQHARDTPARSPLHRPRGNNSSAQDSKGQRQHNSSSSNSGSKRRGDSRVQGEVRVVLTAENMDDPQFESANASNVIVPVSACSRRRYRACMIPHARHLKCDVMGDTKYTKQQTFSNLK